MTEPDRQNIPSLSAPVSAPAPVEMTKKERRAFMFGALKAALVMWAVITGGIVLFVLFCIFVWLR